MKKFLLYIVVMLSVSFQAANLMAEEKSGWIVTSNKDEMTDAISVYYALPANNLKPHFMW